MFKSIVYLWKNGHFSTLFILRMMLCDVLIFIRVKKKHILMYFLFILKVYRDYLL